MVALMNSLLDVIANRATRQLGKRCKLVDGIAGCGFVVHIGIIMTALLSLSSGNMLL